MDVTNKFETLEEVLECVKPKNVFIVVEVEQDYKHKNNLDHAVRAIGIVERIRSFDEKIIVSNGTAFLQPTPKGHAKLFNHYVFISLDALQDIKLSDLAFVYRLDGKCEIIQAKTDDDKITILPYTLVK